MSVRSKLRRNCYEIWRKSKLSPSFSLSPSPLRLWFRHSDICNRRCEAANSDHNSPLGRSRESSVTTRTDKMKRKRALTDKPTENREGLYRDWNLLFCRKETSSLSWIRWSICIQPSLITTLPFWLPSASLAIGRRNSLGAQSTHVRTLQILYLSIRFFARWYIGMKIRACKVFWSWTYRIARSQYIIKSRWYMWIK